VHVRSLFERVAGLLLPCTFSSPCNEEQQIRLLALEPWRFPIAQAYILSFILITSRSELGIDLTPFFCSIARVCTRANGVCLARRRIRRLQRALSSGPTCYVCQSEIGIETEIIHPTLVTFLQHLRPCNSLTMYNWLFPDSFVKLKLLLNWLNQMIVTWKCLWFLRMFQQWRCLWNSCDETIFYKVATDTCYDTYIMIRDFLIKNV